MSYEDLQRLGLSKAIDEYHKLLQAGLKGAESDDRNEVRSGFPQLLDFLKWTVLRPLPVGHIMRNISVILIKAWITVAFFLFHTSVITIPVGACYLLAPPEMIYIPVPKFFNSFSLAMVPTPLTHAWHMRIVVFLLFAISLWASHATILYVSAKRKAAEEVEMSNARTLETWYTNSNAEGQKLSTVGGTHHHNSDVASFVVLVAKLARQYDDNHEPIADYRQAVAWLIQICPELDIPVSRELMAQEFMSAKQALVAVHSVLGAPITS